MRMKFEGGRQLQRAMMDLTHVASRGVARRALMKGGKVIADLGAAKAPRDEGHLADSYGVGTKLTKRQAGLNRKRSKVEVYAGPNDPAAVQTEFGNYKDAPQPHLRPAFAQGVDPALAVIRDEMATEVDKALARRARKLARQGRG